jgi:hypothetical protein
MDAMALPGGKFSDEEVSLNASMLSVPTIGCVAEAKDPDRRARGFSDEETSTPVDTPDLVEFPRLMEDLPAFRE